MTQSPHEGCTAHSGMMTKLNANLIINILALGVLSFLLYQTVAITGGIESNKVKLVQVEKDIAELKIRVLELERQNWGDK